MFSLRKAKELFHLTSRPCTWTFLQLLSYQGLSIISLLEKQLYLKTRQDRSSIFKHNRKLWVDSWRSCNIYSTTPTTKISDQFVDDDVNGERVSMGKCLYWYKGSLHIPISTLNTAFIIKQVARNLFQVV